MHDCSWGQNKGNFIYNSKCHCYVDVPEQNLGLEKRNKKRCQVIKHAGTLGGCRQKRLKANAEVDSEKQEQNSPASWS